MVSALPLPYAKASAQRTPSRRHWMAVSRIVGSQPGSQQSQILSDTRPRPASIGAARWHVRLHLEPSGDAQSVPSGQRVVVPILLGAPR